MATTIAGNAITGHVGITCWADAVIAEGLLVELCGDYKVRLPAGADSVAILGHVIKKNSAGGVANNLTVEAYGFGVATLVAGGAITAGALVKVDTAGEVVAFTSASNSIDHSCIGIALHRGVDGEDVDILTFR